MSERDYHLLNGFEFFAQYNFGALAIEVSGVRRGAFGNPERREVLQEAVVTALDEEADYYPNPWLRLDPGAAEALLTALWHAGIRPSPDVKKSLASTSVDSEAALLVACTNHLDDLKKIAFSSDTVPVPRALYELMCGILGRSFTEEK